MTEIPDAAVLMSMVKSAGAGFTDNKWDELLALIDSQAEAIQRVRELATNAITEQEQNGGQVTLFPSAILKALDGEQ